MNLEEQKKFILSGNMYNDLTEELVAARENTVFLTNEYSGSVVTKNIPSNVVAAGVPCKVIREITEADKTGYRP